MRGARLRLPNTDFDTGRPTARGEYSLADDTYDELLGRLAGRAFAGTSGELRSNLIAYCGEAVSAKIQEQLASLKGYD